MFPTCDLGSGPAGKSVRENHRIAVEKFHDQRQVPAHGIYRFAQSHGSIPRQFNTVIVRSSEVANQNNMVVMQERYARQQDFVDGVARLQGDFSPARAGSGTVSGWTLTLMPMSGGQPVDIATGSGQIVDGVLGTLDPTLMLNGTYDLVLTVVGSNGSQTQSTANISVEGNPKAGNFTLSFTDLDVPVAGLAMQIDRTYDSRNQPSGDFGVGWSLGVHNVQVEESGVLGDGWQTYLEGGGLLQGNYGYTYVAPVQSHFVDIVQGNGKVYRFEPHFLDSNGADVAPGGAGQNSLDGVYTVQFEPLFGTAPNCSLAPIDGSGNPMTSVYAEGSPAVTPQELVWSTDGGGDYEPERFILTDESGNRYVVNTSTGLEGVTDLNNNKLTVDTAGVHWQGSAGGTKDILFMRDGQGRITQIQDPNGALYRLREDH